MIPGARSFLLEASVNKPAAVCLPEHAVVQKRKKGREGGKLKMASHSESVMTEQTDRDIEIASWRFLALVLSDHAHLCPYWAECYPKTEPEGSCAHAAL